MGKNVYDLNWGLSAFFYGVIYIIILGYVDLQVISPLILPEDPCYYHTHKMPGWVDFFYMNAAFNGHPGVSFKHLFLLIVVGFVLGHFTSKRIRLKRTIKNKTQ